MTELWEHDLCALSEGIARGDFTSTEVVLSCLQRVELLDRGLNAFLRVDADLSLAQAAALDRDLAEGRRRGPLHGIPIAIKDIIDVEGLPTTGNSRIAITDRAERDAFVVQRLRAAGAVIFGKTMLHEYATGGPSFDLPWPPSRNPWNRDHHPGGSSSGSGAALAAGMVPGALGTDTAGSVRHPATACGLVGMKPTYGAVSRGGVFPLAPSLDQVGPMTRTVRDNALLFDACLGRDAADPSSRCLQGPVSAGIGQGVSGLRIALLDAFNAPADPVVQAAIERAVEALRDQGAEVVPVATPPIEEFNDCARLLIQAESHAVHRRALAGRADDYGWRARTKLLCGAFVDAATYIEAQKERRRLSAGLHAALSGYSAALCASSFHLPSKIDDDDAVDRTYDRQARIAFNLTGGPAIALPAALSDIGLPTGVQIAALPGQDATVYRVAAALEAAIGISWLKGTTPPWRSH